MKHLTDNQIQSCLKTSDNLPSDMADHISLCQQCRESLETYRRLEKQLRLEPDVYLSEAFTENILQRVVPESSLNWKKWGILAGIPGIVILIGSLYLLFRLKIFTEPAPGISFRPILTQFSSAFTSIAEFLTRNLGNPLLVASAALVLVIFMLLDRWVIQPKVRAVNWG